MDDSDCKLMLFLSLYLANGLKLGRKACFYTLRLSENVVDAFTIDCDSGGKLIFITTTLFVAGFILD